MRFCAVTTISDQKMMTATWAMMPEKKICIAVAHNDCETSQSLEVLLQEAH